MFSDREVDTIFILLDSEKIIRLIITKEETDIMISINCKGCRGIFSIYLLIILYNNQLTINLL